MGGFSDHGPETAMAQPFLETGEQRRLIAGLDMDYPIGRQPRLRDRRGKEIGTCHDPEHLTFGPGGDPGREHCRRRAIHGPIAAAGDLMQASQPQSASRKPLVDLGKVERQDLAHARSTALKVRYAPPKLGDNRVCRAIGHEKSGSPEGFPTPSGADMFIICSVSENESIGLCKESFAGGGDATASNGTVLVDCR